MERAIIQRTVFSSESKRDLHYLYVSAESLFDHFRVAEIVEFLADDITFLNERLQLQITN